MTNFQDNIRDSFDESNKALKVNVVAGSVISTGQATVTLFGTPTINAVVNTSAAGDSIYNIGFATVAVSNPTLYAVVNTSAPGVGNSIVTVANTPLSTQIIGNVTIDSGVITTITNPISLKGNLTIDSGNISVKGNITISDSKGFIGLVTVVQGSTSRSILGNMTLDAGSKTQIVGNVTLSDSKGFIGLVTVVQGSTSRSILGNITLSDSKGFVGLVSVSGFANPLPVTFSGNVTIDSGNVSLKGNVTVQDGGGSLTVDGNVGILGNITINPSVNWLGFATVTSTNPGSFTGNVTLDAGSFTGVKGNITINSSINTIGFATVYNAAGSSFIGLVSIQGNVVNSASPNFIGIVTVTNQPALVAGDANIGLVSVLGGGIGLNAGINGIGFATVKVDSGTQFIGLVTAWNMNAGTTKSLIQLPITLSITSVATIAVGTGGNAIFKVTDLLVSANATVRVSIKSGVTYLNGNASIGTFLAPNGGWVQHGSPDSPVYLGLTSGSALVVEKNDITTLLGGSITYFQE